MGEENGVISSLDFTVGVGMTDDFMDLMWVDTKHHCCILIAPLPSGASHCVWCGILKDAPQSLSSLSPKLENS